MPKGHRIISVRPDQKKKKYKYQSVLERKKRNFPFVVFLCRKP